jgi:hypothetical protein
MMGNTACGTTNLITMARMHRTRMFILVSANKFLDFAILLQSSILKSVLEGFKVMPLGLRVHSIINNFRIECLCRHRSKYVDAFTCFNFVTDNSKVGNG